MLQKFSAETSIPVVCFVRASYDDDLCASVCLYVLSAGFQGVGELQRELPGAVDQQGAAQGPGVLAGHVPRSEGVGGGPSAVHAEAVAGDGRH